jgi:hypothetical protein
MKVFDKHSLITANNLAEKLGYNRQIDPAYLNSVREDQLWVVTFTMIHEQKAGKPTEPHIRCMMYPMQQVGKNQWKADRSGLPITIDVVPEIYERLPDTEPVS